MRKPLPNLTDSHGLVGRTALDDTGTSRCAALRAPDSEAEKKILHANWTTLDLRSR